MQLFPRTDSQIKKTYFYNLHSPIIDMVLCFDHLLLQNIQEADRSSEGFYIRSGIIIILKNSTIKDGFVIWWKFLSSFFGNYEKNQVWNESQSSSIMFGTLCKVSFGYCCAYLYFFSELLAQRLHFLLQLMKWSD